MRTSFDEVQEHLAMGNHVILEIDWQGARQVRESMPDCVSIFILHLLIEQMREQIQNVE